MKQPDRLTPQEEAVMNTFWLSEATTVKDALEKLSEPRPPYTTVASVVRNLEIKGYLRSESIKNRYIYHVQVSQEEYSEKTFGRMVEQYFEGSYAQLVQQFVSGHKLTREDLRELIDLIDQGEE